MRRFIATAGLLALFVFALPVASAQQGPKGHCGKGKVSCCEKGKKCDGKCEGKKECDGGKCEGKCEGGKKCHDGKKCDGKCEGKKECDGGKSHGEKGKKSCKKSGKCGMGAGAGL